MSDYSRFINKHYGATNICARILERLQAAGKDLDALTRDDLAPFDEFHGGGRESTRALARFAGLTPRMELLDVGSGVGGPARTLAAEFGCRVTGLDLTEEFCRAAAMLTEKVGLNAQVRFRHGNAVDMPFADASFNVVWSQHTLMNIEHKAALFREIHRVLRPGGMFAFEAILSGGVPDIRFPVFWADTPALSFLVTAEEAKKQLADAGLREHAWEDTTRRSIAMARKRKEAMQRERPPLLHIGVIVTTNVPAKVENSLRNNEEGRTTTVQALYVKP